LVAGLVLNKELAAVWVCKIHGLPDPVSAMPGPCVHLDEKKTIDSLINALPTLVMQAH
jgi:hypothetical protein